MTDFQRYRERTYDIQDGFERHIWGEQEYLDDAGSMIKVNGTGTEDQEAAVLNIGGVSFNLPKNTNTEVLLLSGGSDTNLKFAILTIPRDKQRKWAEGTGGVQHPTDASFALEFNGKRAHITQAKFAVGDGELEVSGGQIYIRGDLNVSGSINVGGTSKVGGDSHVSGTLHSSHGDSHPTSPGDVPGFES